MTLSCFCGGTFEIIVIAGAAVTTVWAWMHDVYHVGLVCRIRRKK